MSVSVGVAPATFPRRDFLRARTQIRALSFLSRFLFAPEPHNQEMPHPRRGAHTLGSGGGSNREVQFGRQSHIEDLESRTNPDLAATCRLLGTLNFRVCAHVYARNRTDQSRLESRAVTCDGRASCEDAGVFAAHDSLFRRARRFSWQAGWRLAANPGHVDPRIRAKGSRFTISRTKARHRTEIACYTYPLRLYLPP